MVGVTQKAFVTSFVDALNRRSAAIFVGAGLSRETGFLDWKALLHDIAKEIGLSVDKETDLIEVAQFHENEFGGRDRLNAAIIDELVNDAVSTENHKLLAELPVDVVWTTNYDMLIEKAFEQAGKRPDVKRVPENLATTRQDRDVVIYKMHGDVSLPHEAVLTKDDYEQYTDKRALFAEALQGDLVNRNFLFLGYSFADPNVAYILARIRTLLGRNRRTHYCIMRRPQERDYNDRDDFIYDQCRFDHRVNDLKRYGIQIVAIDDYGEVTLLIKEVHRQQRLKTIFFSGAAHQDAEKPLSELHKLSHELGARLISDGYRVVSGVGLGIGGSFVLGAVEALSRASNSTAWERLKLRPFPQDIPSGIDEPQFKTTYRRNMISNVGAGIFVAGVKKDRTSGRVIDSPGVLEEFEMLVAQRGYPIPIGATGGMSRQLWEKVRAAPETFFGPVKVTDALDRLGDPGSNLESLKEAVFDILRAIRMPQVPA